MLEITEDASRAALGLGALALVVYVGWLCLRVPPPRPIPVRPVTPRLPQRDFTPAELAKYDGKHAEVNNQVYIAVDGTVYDVSGKEVYGEGGSYHNLVGRDASYALATMDLSATSGPDLTEAQKGHLKEWVSWYQDRYPVVGKVVGR